MAEGLTKVDGFGTLELFSDDPSASVVVIIII
jgi:hypothetical protein